MTIANPSGDGQSGARGTKLQAFRVQIRLGTTAQPGRTVQWLFTAGGGTLSESVSSTDASGVASTRLTLPGQGGLVQVRASANSVSGSPITFSAVAVVPGLVAAVNVVNNSFDPSTTTILPGGTVVFQWPNGSKQHDIRPVAPKTIPVVSTIEDGPFAHTAVFPTAGTYDFFCSVHGSATSGMRGRIVVE
jgi:plastocyanin